MLICVIGKILFYAAVFIALHLLVVLNISNIPLEQISFPLKENPKDYFPPMLYPLAGFDGVHYIMIAKHGYGEFQQAFFPLYPLLINTLSKLFSFNVLLAGVIISWATLIPGIIFFEKLSKIVTGDNNKSIWAVLFLLSFPSAFFYSAVYPESLFLFFSSASLYFIFKKNYLPAAVFAVFSSLTKIQGIFLLVPFFFSVFQFDSFSFKDLIKKIKMDYKKLFFALSPIYGLLIYSYYLFIKFGDPLGFYHSQEAFGAQRTSQDFILLPQVLFRYIKILFNSQINFQYFISILELSVFLVVFVVLLWDLFKLYSKKQKNSQGLISINLYSLAVIILPTLTGTLSSLPRYALLSFGFFLALAKIKNITYKTLIVIIFGIMHLILFVFFIKGYFVS